MVPVRLGCTIAGAGPGTSGVGAPEPGAVAAFLGAETLWAALRRMLTTDGLVVSVTVGAALFPEATTDRRRLARVAESVIRLADLAWHIAMYRVTLPGVEHPCPGAGRRSSSLAGTTAEGGRDDHVDGGQPAATQPYRTG